MNDVEKRARETLSKVALPSVRYVSMLGDAGTYDDAYYSALVDALSAAGLLRTDLHERALAACRALSKNSDEMGYAYLVNEYADACRHVGREALERSHRDSAAERAKDEGPWRVQVGARGTNNVPFWQVVLPATHCLDLTTEPEARAVAAALNEVWRRERKP